LDATPEQRQLLVESPVITRWHETGAHAEEVLRWLFASIEPEPEGPRAIAGLVVGLGRLDALVFTGGIAENSAVVRSQVLSRLGFLRPG
jgi:acetate kinase